MLDKQSVVLTFGQGLDTKTDKNVLPLGKFISLSNSQFDILGRLTKRNGFGALTGTAGSSASYLTTFKDNLISIGDSVNAYNQPVGAWNNTGGYQSVQIDTLSLIRNMNNQTYVDSAISPNDLLCVVYNEPFIRNIYKYAVVDRITGQNIVPPTLFPTSLGTVSFSPRVFAYQNYFVLVFNTRQNASAGSNSYNLSYTSINSLAPTTLGTVSNFSTSNQPSGSSSFDGVVATNSLYLAWNGYGSNSAAQGVMAGYIQGIGSTPVTKNIASASASLMSVTADGSGPVIWPTFYDTTGSGFGNPGIFSVPLDQNLGLIHGAIRAQPANPVANIATVSRNQNVTVFYENIRTYAYSPSTPNPSISSYSTTPQGSASGIATVVRSVGLASKAFNINSSSYFLSTYQSTYQNSYFLMNSNGGIVAKLAYGNGGGLLTQGLPSVSIIGSSASVGYLIKDFIVPVNKLTAVSSTTQTTGIYTQTGINQANFNFSTSKLQSVEIGDDLHINGGFLWMYDGFKPVEHNAFLYPDTVNITSSGVSGSMVVQTYYYQFTYEWTDNQGNIFRSAPSVPYGLTIPSNTGSIYINVPTPRLSYKFTSDFNTGAITTTNPVRLVAYRWSTAQPIYFQQTSIVLDSSAMALEFIPYEDTLSDSQLIGNNIIYTNGGTVEDIQAPGSPAMTLFDDRLWLINAENKNELWFSKQVIQNTPVEMSELFTLFVAPTTASQISTGPMKAIAPMDDKLIIFKQGAIYYINGTGPDNTGANSQYSQPIFITSGVGCSNQKSIVLVPNGLMFQSDKGIWLLGRNLSVQYIGKDVEQFNSSVVTSALAIPTSNQVKFVLNTGEVLMYDYFVGQWDTDNGIANVSSTLYKNLHTYIDSTGKTFQETPGLYFDGSTPVVMSFTTGFVDLAGLEGYKRVYRGYLLGTFLTSHNFTLGLAYDFDSTITQTISVTPDNTQSNTPEQWQLNFDRQQCQSFQLTFTEIYNTSAGSTAAGLTVSGLSILAGVKKSRPQNIAPKHRKS